MVTGDGPDRHEGAETASENTSKHPRESNESATQRGSDLDEAVRTALSVQAKEIANQIVQSSHFNYQATLGHSPILDDAVREALTGPAKEIANQIAQSTHFNYQATLGHSPILDDAVREALTGPAKEIADQIGKTSLSWLRSYSGQTLEPALFSSIAHILARDEFADPQSDYLPTSIEVSSGNTRATPSALFERFEIDVKSVRGLLSELDRLTRKLEPLSVAWRGQGDADWGLQSTLYRKLRKSPGFVANDDATGSTVGDTRIPTEDDMVAAEHQLLSGLGDRWRLGHSPGIELLARMQHRGVPTRMLDATKNPLVALWFAVNRHDDADARLFAVAHHSIPRSTDPKTRTIDRAFWSESRPFWFDFESPQQRVVGAWGTGTRLREVMPPEYDRRILAQNAVFLLDGVPALTDSVLELFNEATGGSWTPTDIAESMSVVLAPGDPSQKRPNSPDPLSSVYSFRIPSKLKGPIRMTLKRTYGLDWETIYPDMDGIKAYIDAAPDWINPSTPL